MFFLLLLLGGYHVYHAPHAHGPDARRAVHARLPVTSRDVQRCVHYSMLPSLLPLLMSVCARVRV